MAYQVNLNQTPSVYAGKTDGQNIIAAWTREAESADKANGSVQAATEADEGLMQVVNGDEEVVRASSTQVMKNTEQYMELLEKNGTAVSEDDVESEEEARERKKEIYKNLSSEELAKLKMMQVDLSTVSLSDIAGLVNAIRSEAHQQEFNQRIADICDGIDAVRGRVDHESLKEALSSLLPDEMRGLTIDSVLEEGYQISEQQMIYLLKNEMQLTISNLYKSEYATSSGVNQSQQLSLDAETMKLLEPQIDSVILQSGIELNRREDLVSAAQFMIQHEIPLTPATLRNYVAIQELNAQGIQPQVVASNMLVQEAYERSVESANVYFDQRQIADQLFHEVATLSGEAISVADRQQMPFTIQNLSAIASESADAQLNVEASVIVTDNTLQMSKAELTARRQLEEIRLSMTQSAAIRLVMSDIHIDTRELADVVKQLRELELAMTKETFTDYGMKYQREQGELYQESIHKVEGLKQMPAALLGVAVEPDTLTVNRLYEQGMKYLAGREAIDRYETVMTVPRADMGDSISKAFERVDSLLEEMHIETTEENRRAARILGYNQMEITEEALTAVKDADAKVRQMLNSMTPRAVLGLIRNGHNPLEMSVEELNTVLEEEQADAWVQSDEKYSAFLYKLEHKGDIKPEERESYIGIFRLLDKISRQSGRDIGFVVKAGQELTLKNLLSAHRSNQAKGMDVTVSDEMGALEELTTQSESISEQIAQAFRQYGEPAVARVLEEMQSDNADNYDQEIYEAARNLQESEGAWRYLKEQGSVVSQGNLLAAEAMLRDNAGIYGMTRKWLAKTQKQADSDDVEVFLGRETESLFADVAEKFDSQEAVKESYEAIADHLGQMSQTELTGVLTYQDIQSLKQIHTGFSLLRQEAEQESFQVPIQADGKWMMMHVSFERQEEERDAGITFSMQHERLGLISANIVTGEHADGEIRTEQQTLEWPQEILSKAAHAESRASHYELAKEIFKLLANLN